MRARATRKAEPVAPPPGVRRNGRPRSATAAARIYADLRAEMVSLARRPGEPISEGEIASYYGVSRTPVREAILKLSDEGLVEIFPQSGINVSRIPIAALPEAIVIRRALEETTTRLTARHATSSQILTLRSIVERQREEPLRGCEDRFNGAARHAVIAEIEEAGALARVADRLCDLPLAIESAREEWGEVDDRHARRGRGHPKALATMLCRKINVAVWDLSI